MPEFQYVGRDANGRPINGKRNALSAEDLAAQLQNESITPIEITRAQKKEAESAKKTGWKRPRLFKKRLIMDSGVLCNQQLNQ